MNKYALSDGKGFSFSLRFVSLFAAAHVVLVFLQSNFVPLSDGWNLVWLGLELLLALGALAAALGCYGYARRNDTDSLSSFRDLFKKLKSPGFLLLLLWVIWAYIACFLAIREGRTTFYHNVRYLFYQTADLLVLFPLGLLYGARRQTRFLKALFDVCLAMFTLQLIYGFFRFFRGEAVFTAFFGRKFDFSILRAIFGVNSNHTGAYAAFFLIVGIWRFRSLTSRTGKALLIAALIVCFAAFAMVESRGAILALAAGVGVFVGGACWRSRKKDSPARAALAVFCCVLGAAAFLFLFYGARSAVLSVQNDVLERIYENAAAAAAAPPAQIAPSGPVSAPETDANAAPPTSAPKKDENAAPGSGSTKYIAPAAGASGDQERRDLIGKGASTLGGRKKIWLTVIRGAVKDPHILIHGSSMASTSDWVATVLKKAFRTHNQFLELLVAQGLPSLVLFLFWLIWLAGKSLSLGLGPGSRDDWLLPLPLLVLIIHNMVEMMLVARPHVVCGFFYLIAGYTAGLAPGKK